MTEQTQSRAIHTDQVLTFFSRNDQGALLCGARITQKKRRKLAVISSGAFSFAEWQRAEVGDRD